MIGLQLVLLVAVGLAFTVVGVTIGYGLEAVLSMVIRRWRR